MQAILSDIHGNLEALEAVLADAELHGAEEIICLGNLIGYGPDPIACVERAMAWRTVLTGNFDKAAVSDEHFRGFSVNAERMILSFRRSLVEQNKLRIREFLASRPTARVGDPFYVHGTPRRHLNGRLDPADIHAPERVNAAAESCETVCFRGNGDPGLFIPTDAASWRFLTPPELVYCFRRDARKVVCNVGSVGKPRDGDPRACYVLYDGAEIRFRRVEYNIERTVAKIHRHEDFQGFDDFLAETLRKGH